MGEPSRLDFLEIYDQMFFVSTKKERKISDERKKIVGSKGKTQRRAWKIWGKNCCKLNGLRSWLFFDECLSPGGKLEWKHRELFTRQNLIYEIFEVGKMFSKGQYRFLLLFLSTNQIDFFLCKHQWAGGKSLIKIDIFKGVYHRFSLSITCIPWNQVDVFSWFYPFFMLTYMIL